MHAYTKVAAPTGNAAAFMQESVSMETKAGEGNDRKEYNAAYLSKTRGWRQRNEVRELKRHMPH